jgi:hypothetical protein
MVVIKLLTKGLHDLVIVVKRRDEEPISLEEMKQRPATTRRGKRHPRGA